MCNYTGYEFGAGGYPDSCCIDGKLYDLDYCDSEGNLYEKDEDIPCPICRMGEAIEWHKLRMDDGNSNEEKINLMAKAVVLDIRANRGIEGARKEHESIIKLFKKNITQQTSRVIMNRRLDENYKSEN